MNAPATELYQKAVLDHNRAPRHYGALSESTHTARGRNPICGDDVEIFIQSENKRLTNIGFTAQSCALCRASASMMCAALHGVSMVDAHETVRQFRLMILNRGELISGDPGSLAVTRDYPARAKCVLLPWQTFVGAMSGQVDISTETAGV